jgi:dihydrofolate reductase
MKNLFLFIMVSADGFFEGPDNDISWHNTDEEFEKFALEQLDEADTIIMGRRTNDLMAGYWPADEARQSDPETARRMMDMRKIVFSRTGTATAWQNTEVLSDVEAGIAQLTKDGQGGNAIVLGSSELSVTLLKLKLLKEIRLMVNPVVLGAGTLLFSGLDENLGLQLTTLREFKNGNVLLTYNVLY